MYDFSISTLGWYNVDAYLKEYPGVTEVKVNVEIEPDTEVEVYVYLLCPDKRILVDATRSKNGTYYFNTQNGTIPLFLNDRAILLAFGTFHGKTFYGSITLNVTAEQTPVIKMKETTPAELKSFIELNKLNGSRIDETKNEMIFQPGRDAGLPVRVAIDTIRYPCGDSSKKMIYSAPVKSDVYLQDQ